MMVTELCLRIVLMGIGATVVMDIGSIIQRAMKMPTLDYAMVGRWAGHICRGQWTHQSIGKAPAIAGESVIGWIIHYCTGILFSALLVAVQGTEWLLAPTPLPAVMVGMATVVVPFFIMQPAMGVGIAASRTPSPWINRLRSLLNHAIFGLGLYLATLLTRVLW